ncbi:MAG TPA: phosphatase PAP2 family protein [Oligella sp.]|nr:phosphatase PAP2 family protein [Oligella sp.]
MKPSKLELLGSTDTRLFFWLSAHNQKKAIVVLSQILSTLGNGPLYALIGISLWTWGGDSGKTLFYAGVVAYCFELPIYYVLKNSIKRDRPCYKIVDVVSLITPSDKFSFPSGHTAAAFVFANIVVAFFPALAIPVYFFATLVGLSRVMLGVHYPGDILAGMMLGLACSWAALALVSA